MEILLRFCFSLVLMVCDIQKAEQQMMSYNSVVLNVNKNMRQAYTLFLELTSQGNKILYLTK